MYRFVFVVHGGALEPKSALLAASLRQKLGPDGEIAAAVMAPTARWGEVTPACRALFDQLEIRLLSTRNVVDEDYPHGNKIAAMAELDGPAIFLDSDMLMLRPFLTHYSLHGTDAAMKTADANSYVRHGGSWASAYHLFDLPLPARTHIVARTGEWMRPYYNAGFICVKDGRRFSECWADTARRLEAAPAIVSKRPWLDQVALPIALARLGWSTGEASELLNYPLHLQAMPAELPYIAHYHFPHVAAAHEPLLRAIAHYLRKHKPLRAILSAQDEWADILGAAA